MVNPGGETITALLASFGDHASCTQMKCADGKVPSAKEGMSSAYTGGAASRFSPRLSGVISSVLLSVSSIWGVSAVLGLF